ncbi:MAG: sigma-70 family RNA polymerase sigma factor [Actinomycetota bacterium]
MTARNALSVESVWDEFGSLLQAFVRRHVADRDAADDIVGDIVLRIHQHLDDLADHERLTAWLFRIARNAVTDHYRRTGRRRELLDADPEPREAASSADSWLDDQDAVYAELAGCIRPLVEALPADYRRALELTDFEGRTQAEAARLEGISLSGMKSRVQRGRRQFAALVGRCCNITTDAGGRLVDFQRRGDGCGSCEPRS